MVRDGKAETWVGPRIATLRKVAARKGNVLTLDVPVTDSYDREYLQPEGAEVAKVEITGTIEQDAVESLHIVAPARTVSLDDPLFGAVDLTNLRDGWVRDLLIDETTNGIDVNQYTARITIENVVFRHTTEITSPAKPADFGLRGTQILVYKCGSSGNNLFYAWTGAVSYTHLLRWP